MDFLTSKPAASAAVASAMRLPQATISFQAQLPASNLVSARRPQPAPINKRGLHRADQSRYQAQCRRAMSF